MRTHAPPHLKGRTPSSPLRPPPYPLHSQIALYSLLIVLMVPQMYINNNGGHNHATAVSIIAIQSVGNLQVTGDSGVIQINDGAQGSLTPLFVARLYAAFDFIGVVIFMLGYFWIRVFIKREDEQINKFTLTLSDYSLFLANVPPGTTKQNVEEWVRDTVEDIDCAELAKDINANYRGITESSGSGGVREAWSKELKKRKDKGDIFSSIELADPTLLRKLVFKLADVTIVHDHQTLLTSLDAVGKARKAAHIALGALKARTIKRVENADAYGNPLIPFEDSALSNCWNAKKKVLRSCDRTADWWNTSALERDFAVAKLDEFVEAGALNEVMSGAVGKMDSVAVFVTFEHQAAKEHFEKIFEPSWFSWLFTPLICPKRMLKGSVVNASTAPMPSGTLYENLGVTAFSRSLRFSASFLCGGVFIILSFIVIYLLQRVSSKLATELNPYDCSTPLFSTFVNTMNSKGSNADFNAMLGMKSTNPLMYCLCASKSWGRPVELISGSQWGANPQAVAANNINEVLPGKHCPYQVCPLLNKLVRSAAAGKASDSIPECATLTNFAWSSSAYSFVIGLAITIVNAVLNWAFNYLSKFEGHQTIEKKQMLLTSRNFVASFFNTCLLVVLVNVNWPGDAPGANGIYSDMTPGWYTAVGAGLVSSIFQMAILPFLSDLKSVWVMHGPCICGCKPVWRDPNLWKSNIDNHGLSELLVGPEFDMPHRISSLFTAIFVTYIL